MNKKVVGVILIVAAIGLGWWAWQKVQPYIVDPPPPTTAPGENPAAL